MIFTKDITHFYSNITTEIKILNSHNEMIMNDSWSDDIILHSFDITKSDAYHTLKYSAKMKKYDTYTLYLTINDYSNHIVQELKSLSNFDAINNLCFTVNEILISKKIYTYNILVGNPKEYTHFKKIEFKNLFTNLKLDD